MNIDQAIKNLEELSKKEEIKFPELFSPSFLSGCSSHISIVDFINSSGLNLSKEELLSENGTPGLDRYVNSETTYSTWKEMRQAAWNKYTSQKLSATS